MHYICILAPIFYLVARLHRHQVNKEKLMFYVLLLHIFSFHFCIMNSFLKYCMLPCSTKAPAWKGSETADFHIYLYCKQRNSDSNSVGQGWLLYDGKHGPLSVIWLLFMSLLPKLQILMPSTLHGETLFRISHFGTSCIVKFKKVEETFNKSYRILNSSVLETELSFPLLLRDGVVE